ncbi:2Fe-2S iron-sulfur cluster-binding protein [Stakelama tenebrarum]|uniref:2Fe-2S iron-sulfur cluster binding domain-containing protein n=1 Tax=Stakelama tenebrarum TaxID=2711215 RepID=A0A6G6Y778_9SPHN|nr:2Fe-2S iron-sulfur cluster-binding protein [Sphingosinithalassobacter tenebrarum]QIG80770.1 2Fe-2S iron-sulfur cluster binding domain-containing protein [Sphingosinithalassobacter tenebrarum]
MGSVTVTFVEENGTVKTFENVDTGQSLMEVGRTNGVEGILADCGGCCSCATCHVYVDEEWREKVGTPDDIETDMLDMAEEPKENSRLSCQIQLTEELDGLTVHVAPTGF